MLSKGKQLILLYLKVLTTVFSQKRVPFVVSQLISLLTMFMLLTLVIVNSEQLLPLAPQFERNWTTNNYYYVYNFYNCLKLFLFEKIGLNSLQFHPMSGILNDKSLLTFALFLPSLCPLGPTFRVFANYYGCRHQLIRRRQISYKTTNQKSNSALPVTSISTNKYTTTVCDDVLSKIG